MNTVAVDVIIDESSDQGSRNGRLANSTEAGLERVD